jgi:hypothetical protein
MRKRPWEKIPIGTRQSAKPERPWEKLPTEPKDIRRPIPAPVDLTALYAELRTLTSPAA